MNVGQCAKAVAGAVTAFGGAYTVALTDGTVTTAEWVTVAVATVVAAATVYSVPNESTGKHAA